MVFIEEYELDDSTHLDRIFFFKKAREQKPVGIESIFHPLLPPE